MAKHAPAPLDDIDTCAKHASCSPTTSVAGANCSTNLRNTGRTFGSYSSKTPPALTEDFRSSSSDYCVDVPVTPSPSNRSTAQFENALQIGTPPSLQYSRNTELQVVLQTQRASIDAADFKKWEPTCQMFLPPSLPHVQNRVHGRFSDPLPCPPQLAAHANTDALRNLKIKNTFIDAGTRRSPSLERLLHTRGQARSCPGSRLPSPRQSGDTAKPVLDEFEIVSSEASTADPTEAMPEGFVVHYNYAGACHSNSFAAVLKLEDMVAFDTNSSAETCFLQPDAIEHVTPPLGSAELPSLGSWGHYVRQCKPCAFVAKEGCSNGMQCNFCHLCSPGEKMRRRKEKKAIKYAIRMIARHA